jgi:Bacterial SH3 domain
LGQASSRTIAGRLTSFARRTAPIVTALAIIAGGSTAIAPPVAAAGPKVVVIVGPSGGATSRYLERARSYATQARAYGASVSEIYTPNATWSRVVSASQGANVLIYLGHGNGWPSPYAPYQGATKDGFGLNPTSTSGNTTTKYYGEDRIVESIRLAPNAVVLLNHLCYASGNGEPGSPEPTWDVARKRVDNYAAGFFRAGAGAVLADGHSSLGQELAYLFGPARNLLSAWRADPDANGHERSFASQRTPGAVSHLDPDTTRTGFYRSLITRSSAAFSTASIFGAPLTAKTSSSAILRSRPTTASSKLTTMPAGTRLTVTGPFVRDGSGRTWAPVKTSAGRTGYVAAWLAKYTGGAKTTTSVVLRSKPSTTSASRGTFAKGTRVTVTGSIRDAKYRVWLAVRTSSGKTGWMAAWLMRP